MGSRVILVTGASGFIGTRLCAQLLRRGDSVVGVSRNPGPPAVADMSWFAGNLADYETALGVIGSVKPDVVVHLAGKVGGSRSLDWVRPTFNDNLASTINLLTAVSKRGAGRFLLAGSMEDSAMGRHGVPASPYAASKWAAAAYTRMFGALYSVDAVVLRIFMVYGPGQVDQSKLIPHVVGSLLRGESPALSSGSRLADWVFVDDVVDAILRSAEVGGISGETIDIGSGDLTSVRDVVELLVPLLGIDTKVRFGAMPDRVGDIELAADTMRTRGLLGWTAGTSLEEGLSQTVRWFLDR